MRRKRIKYLLMAIVFIYIVYNCIGLDEYVKARDFNENFDYPLNLDVKPLIEEVLSGMKPSVKPINYYSYKFLTDSKKCITSDKIDLFIIVNSAMENLEQRMAIRQTYGQENITPGYVIKMLFFLGTKGKNSDIQPKLEAEITKYKDIIQIDFDDNYFNLTIKTMMSFRWVFEHCSNSHFYLFIDDDMYVSVPNLLEYVETVPTNNGSKNLLYAGYLFKSGPHRIIWSKWRVGLEEYPWNRWPPYLTGGMFVVSNQAMKVLYVGSFFVKHFRFNDIFLAIVAKKAGVVPTHCDNFYFYKKRYSKEGYRDVIASHGYGERDELVSVWNEQNYLD